MCSTLAPAQRFHLKWRQRHTVPESAYKLVCGSRHNVLSKEKQFDRRNTEVGTRRLGCILMLALLMSACVVVWPHEDDVLEIIENNLRGIVGPGNSRPSDGEGSRQISAGNVTKRYDTQQKDAEMAAGLSSEASEAQETVESTQETDVPGADSSRLPLRWIDSNSLHEISAKKVGEPFYERWPTAGMPGFAVKQVNYDVPREDSICFVHVGKSSGSTVGCYLGFSHHCDNTTMLDGTLPKITTHLFHNDVDNCYDDASYYLFAVRDPVERAKSAFYYNRPDEDCNDADWETYEKYYNECPFHTFEAMTQNGLAADGNASEECKTIAEQAIRGTGEISPIHFYYNYQYYFEALPTNSRIIVIRSEYMVDDWNDLEKRFGGYQDTLIPENMKNHNANVWLGPDDLVFSDKSKDIICHALCNDIKVYKNILRLAENLDASQVEKSIEELMEKCPVEAADDFTCSENMPDISQKVIDNRGPNLS